MKLHYYPETDSLYIEFKARPGADTIEVTEGLNVDIDADGEVVGFDIDQASPGAWICPRWRPRRCPFTASKRADPVSEDVRAYLAEEKARLGR